MISVEKVDNLDLKYKKITSYALCSNGIPLLAPSAFLLHVSMTDAPKTANTYSSRLKSYFEAIENMSDDITEYWKHVSDRAMSGYLFGVLKQQRGLKDISVENHIAALGAFYRFAYKHGYMEKPILFSFGYGDNADKEGVLDSISNELHDQYYDEDEFKKVILANITAKSEFIVNRNELMMKLGYYAGLRSFEVTLNKNLRKDYLKEILPKKWSPKSEKIRIFGKGSKLRRITFPVHLLEEIHSYLWKYERIFGQGNILCKKNGEPFSSENTATDVFADAKKRYLLSHGIDISIEEIELWGRRSFHKSRKCFATNFVSQCYEDGLDPYIELPQAMGHEDISTTFGYIYFEALQNKRQKVLHQVSLENTKLHKKRFGNGDKLDD